MGFHHKNLVVRQAFHFQVLENLGPNLDIFRGIFRLPGQNKHKSDTKPAVLMYCNIFDSKSVSPSSGDFRRRPVPQYSWRQEQEFVERKKLSSRTPCKHVLRQWPEIRSRLNKGICNIWWRKLLGPWCPQVHCWKSESDSLVFKTTSSRNQGDLMPIEKKLHLDLRYYWEFSFQILNVFLGCWWIKLF